MVAMRASIGCAVVLAADAAGASPEVQLPGARDVNADGFAILPDGLDESWIARLRTAIDSVESGTGVRRRRDVYAIRGLLRRAPGIRELLNLPLVRSLVEPILGPGFFAVSGTLFDKTPRANWKVAWHQDLSIAVRARVEMPGFGPWSTKAGVPHVQPPVSVLEGMLAVRFHLDDCGEDNGALRVIPGSHRLGRLSAERIREVVDATAARICTAPVGAIVVMRPLCVHASSSATQAQNRRVIHLELVARDLPPPMEWHDATRAAP